jgi:hypothetical protein
MYPIKLPVPIPPVLAKASIIDDSLPGTKPCRYSRSIPYKKQAIIPIQNTFDLFSIKLQFSERTKYAIKWFHLSCSPNSIPELGGIKLRTPIPIRTTAKDRM